MDHEQQEKPTYNVDAGLMRKRCKMHTAKAVLTVMAAISGLVAAALWFKATIVSVEPDPNSHEAQISQYSSDGGRRRDILATADAQTWWNKWAAVATGIAAACQAVALLIPDNSN